MAGGEPGRRISRLAVVDRGETAVRVLNAVHNLTHNGDVSITTILVHTELDTHPWYGREAGEMLAIAAPTLADPAELIDALVRIEADGVWLGEVPGRLAVVEACERAGMVVVGPSAAAIRAATALSATGPATRPALRPPLRRVEIDVLADDHGTIWCLGGRDVSVRLDGRTVVAESPCTAVGPELGARMRETAVDIARRVGIRGAAVVAFTHDDADFSFDGIDIAAAPVNAATEEGTGVSVIGHRVRVAMGEPLPAEPHGDGFVVAAQLLAEHPDDEGQPNEVALFAFPTGTGVRIDANRRPGDVVDPDDPLLAVVTAWGPDRPTALDRLRRALERTSIVLTAGGTNRSLLLAVLAHEELQAGSVDLGWLARRLGELCDVPAEPAVLLAAAVEAYEADATLAERAFFGAAIRGRPIAPRPVGDRLQLIYRGVTYDLSVDRIGADSYTVRHGREVATVVVDHIDRFERRLACGGVRHRVLVAPTPAGTRIELDGRTHVVDRGDGTVVRADWPALVVEVTVAVGDVVQAGDPIAVLESMKMETTVTAPFSGVVTAVEVAANSQIERGAALLRVRRHHGEPGGDLPVPVDFRGLGGWDLAGKPCERVYRPLGNYLLGFDLGPEELHRLLVQQRRLAEIAAPNDVDLLACEDHLLDIYADLGALYRPRLEVDTDDDRAPSLEAQGTQEYLTSFVQWLDADRAGLPQHYRDRLERALARYGIRGLRRTPELQQALMWLFRSFGRLDELSAVVVAILQRRLDARRVLAAVVDVETGALLDRLAVATQGRQQQIADLARDVRFHFFDEPPMEQATAMMLTEMDDHLEVLATDPECADRGERLARLVWCPHPLRAELSRQWRLGEAEGSHTRQAVAAEVYVRRFYRIRGIDEVQHHLVAGHHLTTADYADGDEEIHLVVSFLPLDRLPDIARAIVEHLADVPARRELVVDLVAWRDGTLPSIDDAADTVRALAGTSDFGRLVRRLTVTLTSSAGTPEEHLRTQVITLRQEHDSQWTEDLALRNVHPMLAERLEMWRLANFALERRPSPEDVYLFLGVAHENPADHRLFAIGEVRELTAATDPVTGETHYPRLERIGLLALAAMRAELARHNAPDRPVANRLVLDVTAPWNLPPREVRLLADRFAPLARRGGLEKVVIKVRIPDEREPDGLRSAVLHFDAVGGTVFVREDRAGDAPVMPLGTYQQKLLTAARFGSPHPYEIVRVLTRRGARAGRAADSFVELDLAPPDDGTGGVPIDEIRDRLVPVHRRPGENTAHLVVGLISHATEVVPEGIERVALFSDPTQGLGNLAEPECRRINAALDLARERRIPVEWFAVSSGALISMESGTENMDWIALTLRRLIEFTQDGGEVNIVVTGINVGGQPYWNAEATMLMHTRGILVMSPSSTMVLTGKQALDFSGAVSADDNFGIGGYERVMGPNGQAQYFATSFAEACDILRQHYELTYVVPGERFPRRHVTADPADRDVRTSPHAVLPESPFTSVGDIFSAELNPERKQPFDMRSLMAAVADGDMTPLERWRDLRDGDTSIVWDTTVGGIPVCMLGIESHTVRRQGFIPSDGPPAWTSGTFFPHSSRKSARAINAASGNRPLVVLANLSGFDGSPESMRRRQLEYGAEIGRAVTNFDGPIVFVVVSRYHGGAFVVFSKALNPAMEIAAVEGSFASVIGGAPAAATVFAREVQKRTQRDGRVKAAAESAAGASGPEAAALRAALADVTARVRSEKLGEVAREFDAVHTIERAQRVGSVDRIIPAATLRPYVIDALERGIART